MKKITLIPALMLALSSLCANAQTVTLIDPAGAGGFELGAEFADNGWSVENSTYGSRKWVIGSAQPGYTGDRCAFIGASATSVGTNAGGRTAHIYRPVTIPTTATNIQLKFKYKQEVVVIDPTTGPNDYILLSLMDTPPTTALPPSSAQFGGKFPSTGPLATFTPFTVAVPDDEATGTQKYLVVTFRSTNLNQAGTVGWGAIDDIELTYTDATAGADEFSQNGFTYYPNPVNNVLNLNYTKEMTAVTVTNMLGQQVITKSVNTTNATVDTSSLAKGTYMVTVQAGSNSKTIKIVK
ncbi:MAG: T9SS type A sorting domain-containing protein [Flavobacterium sp.]